VIKLLRGDNLTLLRGMADASVDSIVTDPPYELTSARPGSRSEATRGKVTGGFMGLTWDSTGVAHKVELWQECLRVLKPGGYLLAFGGTRTFHRLAVAIEDAGFELRDTIGMPHASGEWGDCPWLMAWAFGSGFPKSLDVSKAIDKAAGAEREVVGRTQYSGGHVQNSTESMGYGGCDPTADQRTLTAPATDTARQWQGWGTALKPAWEPIVLARKPLIGTVVENVLKHGTGALNIDGCRVPSEPMPPNTGKGALLRRRVDEVREARPPAQPHELGRWPANLITDGSDEVVAAFPEAPGQCGPVKFDAGARKTGTVYGAMKRGHEPSADSDNTGAVGFKMKPGARRLDSGSAARFFYCSKASRTDRNEGCDALPAKPLNWSSGDANPGSFQSENTDRSARNHHATVKPTDLMRYLVRLVTPPGGTVLDVFMGSGSTGKAAVLEGFSFIGMELDQDANGEPMGYMQIAEARIAHAQAIRTRELREAELRAAEPRNLDLFDQETV